MVARCALAGRARHVLLTKYFPLLLAETETELFVQNMSSTESNTVTRLSCKDLSHHFARPHMCTNKCEQRKKKMLLVIRCNGMYDLSYIPN